MPWLHLKLAGWQIVGMNHYSVGGKLHLFAAMTRGDRCIRAEGPNEADVFDDLATKAKATS